MYLKRLELIGFKSFAEKTQLQFESGITAVVGPNGCGKCLHYGSLVTLCDGARAKIGDLVEEALKNSIHIEKLDDGVMALDNPQGLNILSLNPETFKIESKPVYAFIKRKAPEYLLEINTKSGKRVVTTHYHPFFSINNGQLIELKAEELKEGVRIAGPRVLKPIKINQKLNLLEIFKKFDYKDQVYLPYSQELSDFLVNTRAKYAAYNTDSGIKSAVMSTLSGQAISIPNFTTLLSKNGIFEIPEFIKSLKSRSCGQFILPREMNTSIARFLGYLISEGRTTKENQVWFVNEDRDVVRDFVKSAYDGFGVEAKVFSYKKNAKDVLIFSSALCQFLEKAFDFKISGLSKDKVVPLQIFSCGDKIIAEFLSALFEGDAYISIDRQGINNKNVVYFEYATASRILADDVSSLLLRLGVRSVIRKKTKFATNTKSKTKRDYCSVYVYGTENVKLLSRLLNFAGQKSRKLEQISELKVKANPNLDVIPGVNCIFKTLVKLAGIKVKRFKKFSPKLVSYYEDGCLPSRQGLLEALSVIAEHGKIIGLAKAIYDYLKMIALSDIYWDEIVSIKKINSEQWVYDLSILNNHNFVAQDILVHNSNIFDSIRWVLGEQSVKALRGSNMEDVIFNGTDNTQALNVAEVSLTFSNEQRQFPLDAEEVTVTRRIFRSGESEYLLNKAEVRLRDILELFMGTGIGAEAYSLVEQGKIDLILSSRAEDRRLVFDEASGITKYKSQKKEAMRKLEETENNLLRINDIIQEVKRQIGSLERQANKARRYKEIFEELKAKEISLAQISIKGIKEERRTLGEQLAEQEKLLSDKLARIQALELKLSLSSSERLAQEGKVSELKNIISGLDNVIERNFQHIKLNKERLQELESRQDSLKSSSGLLRNRVLADEDKLAAYRKEYEGLENIISENEVSLAEKESRFQNLNSSIKQAGELILSAKNSLLELASENAKARNQVIDIMSVTQSHEARKKRLVIDKVKISEEKASTEEKLAAAMQEVSSLKSQSDGLAAQISLAKNELRETEKLLAEIIARIKELEDAALSLESQKEFIEKLMLKYQDISEAMNAAVIIDRQPQGNITGLLIKATSGQVADERDKAVLSGSLYRLQGEAKSIDLDPRNISEKIKEIKEKINLETAERTEKEGIIATLNKRQQELDRAYQDLQISLSAKFAQRDTVASGLARICEEKDIIGVELSDIESELAGLKNKQDTLEQEITSLEADKNTQEQVITAQQNLINGNSNAKEGLLVSITQIKTELESLRKRKGSDSVTLKMLEDTFNQNKATLLQQEEECLQVKDRIREMLLQIEDLGRQNSNNSTEKERRQAVLRDVELEFAKTQEAFKQEGIALAEEKAASDNIKNELYQLKIQDQELNFKCAGLKDRIIQAYKVDPEAGIEELVIPEEAETLEQETLKLREKLDSYGTVNLVAIEEYDELKKRYDFLTQQQADLLTAKESLEEAISKINRTTKQLFLETFEKVCEEFKNYFRLLFNGGDARLYLVDEQDPLEAGIEIIARPPGKKLQNVLLLSGGEKSMTAVALLFAIFKVKPVPFCVLDEVDAALDEANVDRFSRILKDFAKTSQFILITHNKKTIANADVMYGITMEKSGISKIVSVKFSHHTQKSSPPKEDRVGEPEPV